MSSTTRAFEDCSQNVLKDRLLLLPLSVSGLTDPFTEPSPSATDFVKLESLRGVVS
jgi:hypothetical protein